MAFIYRTFEEWHELPEIGRYIAWGIRLEQGTAVPDLSTDKNAVAELANRFNQGALSAYHFGDAVEDWLAGS